MLRNFVGMMTKTQPQTNRTKPFTTVKKCFLLYGVLSALALAVIVPVAGSGHTVTTFMWVRGILLPIIAVLLYGMTIAASRGSFKAFNKVRTLSWILPIAIIGIDLIPGVCPRWYAVMQALCMIPVVVAALAIRRPALRGAFPNGS